MYTNKISTNKGRVPTTHAKQCQLKKVYFFVTSKSLQVFASLYYNIMLALYRIKASYLKECGKQPAENWNEYTTRCEQFEELRKGAKKRSYGGSWGGLSVYIFLGAAMLYLLAHIVVAVATNAFMV